MVKGSFPRVTKSDECGICKETHFSKNLVLKREFSHYFHVSFHKGCVEDRASNQHLIAHEILPLFPVCQRVTKVTNAYEEGWVNKDNTVSKTVEGSGNRRRAERRKQRNQKHKERNIRVTQFYEGATNSRPQAGPSTSQGLQSGQDPLINLERMARDRPSEFFSDISEQPRRDSNR